MIDKVTVRIIHKVLAIAANQLLTFDAVFAQTLSIICLNSSLFLVQNGWRHIVIGCKRCAVFFNFTLFHTLVYNEIQDSKETEATKKSE